MMKKRTLILAALALTLTAGAGIGSAHAYFTTYAQAQGGYTLDLGDRTQVQEEFADWTKHVTITSEEGSEPVYVRARAYSGSTYGLSYSGDGWSDGGDGWYYYSGILEGGGSAPELLVQISGVPAEEALKDGDSFHVAVVYESTPVRYHEDGTPYADWDTILESSGLEGGGD